MQVLVARVGKAHGLRGEVTVRLHTDAPEQRFVPGATFAADPATAGPLVLRSARDHNGILLLAFEGTTDRNGAEALRGTRLLADVVDHADPDEQDSWYERDLVGLTAVDVVGDELGEVTGLESRPAQDLLVLTRPDGRQALVPFVAAIVPEVDIEAGRVVIDPPPGLFDLDT